MRDEGGVDKKRAGLCKSCLCQEQPCDGGVNTLVFREDQYQSLSQQGE